MSGSQPISRKEFNEVKDQIADLAKRALMEAAELRDLEERLKQISERNREVPRREPDGVK
jgi:uncharacterized sporulation protein YeaH/YhbH (DUF444 family)